MLFGPHSREFITFLHQAENYSLKDIICMEKQIPADIVDSYQKASSSLLTNDPQAGMMINQVLSLYAPYYPEVIRSVAMGIGSQHVINNRYTHNDYETLVKPLEAVA